MYLNNEDVYKMIISHISIKKPAINKLLSDWLAEKDYNAMNVSPRDLNSKYLSLSKASNPFCKNNFIDYNYMVDQILQMSLPYSENAKINKENESKMGSSYFPKENSLDFKDKEFNRDLSFINHLNYKNQDNKPSKTMVQPIPKNVFHHGKVEDFVEKAAIHNIKNLEKSKDKNEKEKEPFYAMTNSN